MNRLVCDLVVGDWGSTRLRLWGLSNWKVISKYCGMSLVSGSTRSEYAAALIAAINKLKVVDENEAYPPVVLSGMVGSREGWEQIPYCEKDKLPHLMAASVEAVRPGLHVWITPGLSQTDPPDIMRGEETQISGFLDRDPQYNGFVCLPGTHTKWVEIVDGNVRRIQTVMTGELFDLIVSKSVLRHSISAEMDEQTFVSSFRSALLDPAGSLSKIFELRSSDVLQITSCKSVEDFISGLLIGIEIKSMLDRISGQIISVIGNGHISSRYLIALHDLNFTAQYLDGDEASLRGLIKIAKRTGIHNEI